MTKARAAVVHQVKEPFSVQDIELAPVGAHQVRVKLAASGVCHSDLSVRSGAIFFTFPAVLGHEGAGVVVETGSQVSSVVPGDHVVLTWMPACRRCFFCLVGQPWLCTNGLSEALGSPYATLASGPRAGAELARGLATATFATETLVPERSVVSIPKDVPLDLAALIGCALSTGIGAAWRTAEVAPGSSVVVIGCGGVGLAVIMGAKLAGAAQIVAVDTVEAKLEMASSAGATATVLAEHDVGALQAVRELTEGRGGDFVFEVVGLAPTIRQAFSMTRRGGVCVIVGAGSPKEKVELDAMELFLDAKTIKGCVYGSTDAQRDFPQIASMISSGLIDAGSLVSRRIGLEDIESAFEAMTAGEVARCLVMFE